MSVRLHRYLPVTTAPAGSDDENPPEPLTANGEPPEPNALPHEFRPNALPPADELNVVKPNPPESLLLEPNAAFLPDDGGAPNAGPLEPKTPPEGAVLSNPANDF